MAVRSILIAVVAVMTGLLGKASAAFPQASQPHDPSHAINASDWCAAHAAKREIDLAMSDCDHAVATDPKSSKAYSNRGSAWLVAGMPSKALADFDAAIALSPTDASLFFNRGIANAQLKARDKAIADYTEALRLAPDLAIALHNRGYEFELSGKTDQALADYRRALELQPSLQPSQNAIKRLMQGRL